MRGGGALAREFEAAGWDGIAIGEAHGLLPDPYVVLAIAAAATTTLRVGTSTAVPLRHPLLAADAMATVQALSGGRARFVIARGDGAMKVLQREPMRVSEFEAYLRQLMAFLRREEVEIDGAVSSMSRLDDIDPSLGVTRPEVSVGGNGSTHDRGGHPLGRRNRLLGRRRCRSAAGLHRDRC